MSLRRNFRGCRSPHGLVVAVVDVRLSWWLVWETAVVTAVKRRHDLRGRNGWSRWLYPPATGQNSGQCARWTDLCGGRSEGLWDLRFLLSFFYLFFFFLEKTLIEGRDIRFLRVYLCYWISVQALCARRCFFYLNVLKSFKTWTFKGIFISYIWISFRFHLNFSLLKILFSIRYTKYLFFQILDLTKFLHSKQAWLHFCTSFINNKVMQ